MFSSIFKKGKASNRLRSEKGKTDAASTSSVVEQGKKKEAGNVSVEGAFNSSEAQPMLLELEENERFGFVPFVCLIFSESLRYTTTDMIILLNIGAFTFCYLLILRGINKTLISSRNAVYLYTVSRYSSVAGQSDEFPDDSMLDDAWEYCGEWYFKRIVLFVSK